MNNLKSLSHYNEVASNKILSFSKKSSFIPSNFHENIGNKWAEHEDILKNFKNKKIEKIEYSFLDLKIEIADKILEHCILCEKRCNINRNFKKGDCGIIKPRIASEFFNSNEEIILNENYTCNQNKLCSTGWSEEYPLAPSHRMLFAGCNMDCAFCQNHDISNNPKNGKFVEISDLALKIDIARKNGSKNINFIGGEPSLNLAYILKVMRITKENIPVVLNTNMYMSIESMNLLNGFIDLYLTDFKFGNNQCASRLSGVNNYMEIIGRNHKIAINSGSMIIRHLVLPNHIECCSIPIIDWIYENLGTNVALNIMGNYTPLNESLKYEDISKPITSCETSKVINYAKDLGFEIIS
ncbi:radical SAM protein [Methanobrevibacter sp. DSM 116169]|uniref:radical SAM protein n=1 Tax=Methanobrevibacter sp. DSM 116169 TaxID=3242727 RepID=UPI0038FCDD16